MDYQDDKCQGISEPSHISLKPSSNTAPLITQVDQIGITKPPLCEENLPEKGLNLIDDQARKLEGETINLIKFM